MSTTLLVAAIGLAVLWLAARVLITLVFRSQSVVTAAQVAGEGVRLLLNAVVVVGAYALVRRFDPAAALGDALGAGAAVVGNALATTILATAGLLAVTFASRAVLGDVHFREYAPDGAVRRRRVAIVLVLLGLALYAEAAVADLVPGGLLGLPVVAVALWGGVYAPLTLDRRVLPLTPTEVRIPNEDERARIERAYDRFDRSPPDPVVVDTGSRIGSSVAALGQGSLRALVVERSFLDASDDEQLAVALAQAEAAADRWYHEFTAWGVTLSAVVLAVLGYTLAGLVAPIYGFAVTLAWLPGTALLFVGTRRAVYGGDEFAADYLGRTATCETYAQLGEELDARRRTWSEHPVLTRVEPYLTAQPPIDLRLERIGCDAGTVANAPATPDAQPLLPGERTYAWLLVVSPLVVVLASLVALPLLGRWLAEIGVLASYQGRQEALYATISRYSAYVVLLTGLLAPLGVYLDRRRDGGYVPSRLYYATLVPFLNAVVALVYAIQRFRHWTPEIAGGEAAD